MSRDAYTIADDERLTDLLKRELSVSSLALERLPIQCISRIYRITTADGRKLFVKWGMVPDSNAIDFIRSFHGSTFLPKIVGQCELDGKPVFCFEWLTLHRKRIDEMTDVDFDSFVSDYRNLFGLMQAFGKAKPPDDGIEWIRVIADYISRHSLARFILRKLLLIKPEDCRHLGSGHLVVQHGDLHSGNFGFCDDGRIIFIDFDNFIMAHAVEDMAFAFAESIRRSELDWRIGARNLLLKRFDAVVSSFGRPVAEWKTALNLIRVTVAAKSLVRHPGRLRVAFHVALRDRRISRLIGRLEGR